MSETEQGRPGPTDPAAEGARKPAAALELLTYLAAGVADMALDQLRESTERAQGVLRRSDLRELLNDGVVELRKRGELATQRAAAGSENYLETMARRAAERAGHPRA
ncbi:hypothetical protein [Streptomyces sp. G-G2]|uniref:hypothetical protein n=1 Tax=Streptomyces sp. G-G2 TaxID=3046201 RepID=UPI0024BB464A|nr:hypothetical protein [Streptomyces sp. G-G2]MDJ0382730.1 hypothetical protein [Streptomyces sp. G-G2]